MEGDDPQMPRARMAPRDLDPGLAPRHAGAAGASAELVDGLTALTISTLARAREAMAGGDSPALAGAEILDVLDPFLEGLDGPLRGAVERHVRAIVRDLHAGRGA